MLTLLESGANVDIREIVVHSIPATYQTHQNTSQSGGRVFYFIHSYTIDSFITKQTRKTPFY